MPDAPVEIEVNVTHLYCKRCMRSFEGYQIMRVDENELLLDQHGILIFELTAACPNCGTTRWWSKSHKEWKDTSDAFNKLVTTLGIMHAHQAELEKG